MLLCQKKIVSALQQQQQQHKTENRDNDPVGIADNQSAADPVSADGPGDGDQGDGPENTTLNQKIDER